MNIMFKKVKLHNFASYTDAEVSLGGAGYCLVTGKNNYSVDNAYSNGSGKSFIFSGICYALTGETIKGSKTQLKNRLVSDNDMWVELEFSVDCHTYILKRGQVPSKFLQISVDGIDVSGKTFTESTNKLEELLPDLSKNLIASCMIIGQGMPNKFSSFTPSGRKDLLEKLTKSDFMINEIRESIAAELDKWTKLTRATEDNTLVATTKISELTVSMKSAQNQLKILETEKDFANEIAKLEESIKITREAVQMLSASVKSLDEEKADINAKLVKVNAELSTKLLELSESYSQHVGELNKTRADLASDLKVINNEISSIKSIKDVCPTCGQKIPNVVKPDTTQKEEKAKELQVAITEIDAKIKTGETKRLSYKTEIEQQFTGMLADLRESLSKKTQDLQTIKSELQKAEANLSEYNTAKAKLEAQESSLASNIAQVKSIITDMTKKLEEQENTIVKLTADKANCDSHLAVVKKLDTLSKRDFRGYLLTNIISYLDKVAKNYCEIVYHTRALSLELDGNSLEITYDGKAMDNLSGGEQTRVDLILQLAIRNMLQNYLGFNSNILVLDEVTDFLDKQSCKAVMTLVECELKNIESVFIISHHADELDIPIDTELKVIKNEAGISSIC